MGCGKRIPEEGREANAALALTKEGVKEIIASTM
jgi:hypothetical protein